jgi:hypothetical protein
MIAQQRQIRTYKITPSEVSWSSATDDINSFNMDAECPVRGGRSGRLCLTVVYSAPKCTYHATRINCVVCGIGK